MANIKNKVHYKVFIVEDNALYAQILKKQLAKDDYELWVFQNGKDCIANLHEKPDIVTLDYKLPDMTGFQVLKAIQKISSDSNVIVISAQENIDTAIEMMKEGAYDYIVKAPDTREKLSNIIKNIFETDQIKKENLILKQALKERNDYRNLIAGNSREIDRVFILMDKAIQSKIPVSISGEAGTGKELIARGIHYNSDRFNKPFVMMHISSIPIENMESELFGVEKKSNSDYNFVKPGRIEEANQGTLFLDSISDLDFNLQEKLVQVIKESKLARLDGSEKIEVDVRIISSTQNNLAELVSENLFSHDLYYQLLGLPIEVPPLRDRGNDVLLLSKLFVNRFCLENDLKPKRISKEAQEVLLSYSFPGNIRELKALIELACVLSKNNTIKPHHLNLDTKNHVQNLLTSEKSLVEYEQDIINHFLIKYNHNVRLVANKLKIGKSTIYRMLQKKNKN